MANPPLDVIIDAALAAGEYIRSAYDRPIEFDQKSDGSPVTETDKAAEEIILSHLAPLQIPVLGEESVAAGIIPELGDRFFVVDPLDGTKEFIKRNGEFTVNIALVEHGRPIFGVVTAPALGKGYAGGADGATIFDIVDGHAGQQAPLRVSCDGAMNVVASRSHGHKALASLCDQMAVKEDVSVGSSLKFCLVAAGQARLYPRFTPTCEWDTAAGQAVLEAAGGGVWTLDGAPLAYGKADKKFYNPYFVAADNAALGAEARACMRKLI